MPKNNNKTSEEKIAEEYFPVEIEDIRKTFEISERQKPTKITEKTTVEKQYKKPEIDQIETIEFSKGSGKNKKVVRKKSKKRVTSKKPATEFTPQKINLNPRGYELIITEKPQAASKIAAALGKPTQKTNRGVSY